MAVELLRFPHKAIRAKCIKAYMEGRYDRAVCFSCGNAARELEAAGVDTLHIGPEGDLEPRRWFTQREIANMFPRHFDATSGHLPVELMAALGKVYRKHLGRLPQKVYVPTGSGETLVSLKLAYPDIDFVAVYNLDKATEFSEKCPLNPYVKTMAAGIIFADKEGIT